MKFGGIGLSNMLCISFFTILIILGLKSILSQHYVKGLTETILAI